MFHVAAVHKYKIRFCTAFLSKACFMIINFKGLAGKKNNLEFLLHLTAPAAISQLWLNHSTVTRWRKKHMHTCILCVGQGQPQPQTAICAPAGFVEGAFAAEGSVLHKTMRNPNLTWQLSQAACLHESEKEVKWNSSCVSNWQIWNLAAAVTWLIPK